MFTAEITFSIVDKTKDPVEQSDAINMVLGGWRQNGQILGRQFPLAMTEQNYLCYLNLPDNDALISAYENKYVKKWLAALKKVGLERPIITIVGQEPEAASLCDCKSSSSLMLYTTYLSIESPLRCGDCFGVIPLYKIPPTYDNSEYYNILSWQADYQNIDHLQMNCKVAEGFMLKQLLDLESDLSQQGRAITQKITDVTHKPVYYYLMQGKEVKTRSFEQERKCPSCGGDWLQNVPWHDLFHFKCERCSLVSNMAWTIAES